VKRCIACRWPILFGLLVAIVIWFWPIKAVWRIETTDRLLGFGGGGRSVLTISASEDGSEPAHLQQRDVTTRQITASVEIRLDAVKRNSDMRVSADRKALLIGNRGPDDSEDPQTDYFIVDAITGNRRAGPLNDVEHINPISFSKDGRWLWVYHKADNPDAGLQEIDLLSATTGELVLGLRPDEDRNPWSCCFSDDGNRVAVLWRAKEDATDIACQIRLMDVPSGRESRRIELPAGDWNLIHRWDDHSMILVLNIPDGNLGYFRRCREFDLSSPTLSEGIDKPLLSGYASNPDKDGDGFFDDKPYGQTWWADGPGWLAYVASETIPITNWERTLSCVDSWIGTRLYRTKKSHRQLSVRRVNPVSGWTISRIPNISHGWQPDFSDDGRWIAIETNGGLELWDTLPPPRWPWALGAGVIATLALNPLRRPFRSCDRVAGIESSSPSN